MLGRIVTRWGTSHRPAVLGCLWMAVLLGGLAWLDLRRGEIFLVPPFAATMTILLYLSDVSIAQPFAIVFGSTLGAAIGTVLGWSAQIQHSSCQTQGKLTIDSTDKLAAEVPRHGKGGEARGALA